MRRRLTLLGLGLVAAVAMPLPAASQVPGLIRTVYGDVSTVPPGTSVDVFASCEAGEQLVGGGYITPFNVVQLAVALTNGPDPNDPTGRWFVRVRNYGTSAVNAQAAVVCAMKLLG